MVSIIIPIYNGEKYIENIYKQVTELDYSDVEVLLVDDGSKDNSYQKILELSSKDNRFKAFRKENGGIADTRNYGLERAKGEYLVFWDQDDIYHPHILSYYIDIFQKYQVDFIQTKSSRLINGKLTGHNMESSPHIIKRGTDEYKLCAIATATRSKNTDHPDIIVSAGVCISCFRTSFIRKNNIRYIRFLDYEDDFTFMVNVTKHADSFCIDKCTLYTWKVNMMSESHNRVSNDRYIENFYENFCDFRSFLLDVLEKYASEKERELFSKRLQKILLLWGLSNETGRGIKGRGTFESISLLRNNIKREKKSEHGIYKGLHKFTLGVSTHGAKGLKLRYYIFRDKFMTFLLTHHLVWLAVPLNKYLFHGRWHI